MKPTAKDWAGTTVMIFLVLIALGIIWYFIQQQVQPTQSLNETNISNSSKHDLNQVLNTVALPDQPRFHRVTINCDNLLNAVEHNASQFDYQGITVSFAYQCALARQHLPDDYNATLTRIHYCIILNGQNWGDCITT